MKEPNKASLAECIALAICIYGVAWTIAYMATN